MKVGKIRKGWVIFRTALSTITYSTITIIMVGLKVKRDTLNKNITRWAKSMIGIVGLKYSVNNPHKIDLATEKNIILMSNHCSHYDIPLLLAALPGSIRMVAKKELFDIPVFGKSMQRAEFVSIDRSNPRQAVKDLRYAREVMGSGITLWIAPEGHRSPTGELQKFKRGGFMLAMNTKAKIIPVGILGTGKILPAKTYDLNINETAELRLGEIIDVSQYGKEDVAQLMDDVEAQIRQLTDQ